jgi:hypothetical protein
VLAVLRHLLAIVLLPGMVTVGVPVMIARRAGIRMHPPADFSTWR